MYSPYQDCIDTCIECAAACDHCATSCLREEEVASMVRCIQLDQECIAICEAAAKLMRLQSNHVNAICRLCADICDACAEECEKHNMDHCRQCAIACRNCADECRSMAAA